MTLEAKFYHKGQRAIFVFEASWEKYSLQFLCRLDHSDMSYNSLKLISPEFSRGALFLKIRARSARHFTLIFSLKIHDTATWRPFFNFQAYWKYQCIWWKKIFIFDSGGGLLILCKIYTPDFNLKSQKTLEISMHLVWKKLILALLWGGGGNFV